MAKTDRRARLIYVLGQFPAPSETFILREMVALEEMGFHLIPVAMHPAGPEAVHAEAEQFVARTLYRPKRLAGAALRAFFSTLVQRPLGLGSSLWFLLRETVLHPANARELIVSWLTALCFASRLPRRDVRHVHAHWASRPASIALMLSEICGSGYSLSCHVEMFASDLGLLSRKLREADFVTVCTRYAMERLQRDHALILGDKLHLIRHGVEVARMSQQAHVNYPLPLILSVGRLVEKKGFPFLLQAAAVLNGRGLPFELVIVGDGPMRDELERLAGGLGLREKVVFSGHLTQEQLSHVYRRADAFCLASIVAQNGERDGLPNVILEAMAYGVPVVASNLTAIPEAVTDGETGLLAAAGSPQELAAQLERVLSDDELRTRLTRNARRLVEDEFDLMKNTVQLGALFAQALGLRDWPPPEATAPRARDRVEV